MTEQNYYYLTSIINGKLINHLLPTDQVTLIGREASCQIILDPTACKEVSRRHVEIRPLTSPAPNGIPQWQACDLGSANGTYINGQRLQGCQTLQSGDRLILGNNCAEFLFKRKEITKQQQKATIPPGKSSNQKENNQPKHKAITLPVKSSNPIPNNQVDESLHLSHIFPIISKKQNLWQKGYLIPGIFTIFIVIGLLFSGGSPVIFNALLATYLAGLGYYFIYRIAGKRKPWWLLIGSALLTMIILRSFLFYLFVFVFREVLPGNIEQGTTNLRSLFVSMFFGAGMMEELIKAIPVFAALWFGLKLKSPWREKIGVFEPLDGILLGAAAAVGFTLLETLGQYVPGTVQEVGSQYGAGAGELLGLQLLIPRIIGSVAGHMAYSGYFGYFIGLSMLKPSKRWLILIIGYLTSSTLHAFWNVSLSIHPLAAALAGILAYSFLLAAILKARKLSPTRSQNFATQYHPPGTASIK